MAKTPAGTFDINSSSTWQERYLANLDGAIDARRHLGVTRIDQLMEIRDAFADANCMERAYARYTTSTQET